MTPLPAVPPPPPAIHAPIPVQITRNASPFSAQSGQTVQQRINATNFDGNSLNAFLAHGRYMHIKHWKGKPSKSQRSRSNRRKAAKRAKR